MRPWLPLLALLLAGCAEPDRLDPVDSDWQEPLPYVEPEVRVPTGHLELRWPGGDWQRSLSWEESRRVNATGIVTELSLDGVPKRLEARFVGDLDPNGTWNVDWRAASPTCCNDAWRQGSLQVELPVGLGQTLVFLDVWEDRSHRRLHLEAPASVALDWTVHGVVQPMPAQAPDAPPVLQEVRVPAGTMGGVLRVTTEAVGEAPATGRDVRLGYKMLHDEWCMPAPTPGTRDHTDHLMEVPLWGEATTVQLFLGNPSGWCAGTLNGPVNAEPVEYVMRLSLVRPAPGNYH